MSVVARLNSAPNRPAPGHLSPESKRFWRQTMTAFVLEEHHVRLLGLACDALDRAIEARQIVDREGLLVTDRFGAQRPHPAVAIERDARLGVARLLKALDLDVTPPGPT